jgi:hypothetical protein
VRYAKTASPSAVKNTIDKLVVVVNDGGILSSSSRESELRIRLRLTTAEDMNCGTRESRQRNECCARQQFYFSEIVIPGTYYLSTSRDRDDILCGWLLIIYVAL